MNPNNLVVCADIGGSHITACLLNLETKQLITSSMSRLHIDSFADADKIIADWSKCIAEAMGGQAVKKVCLAMPGPFDYEAGICLIKDQGKYPHLYNLNIKELLGTSLGLTANDVYMNNDAACFLQGEVFSGSAVGYTSVIGITLGTGLGTAVCRKGVAHSADLWSLPFRESIAEDYISTRWIVKKYFELTGKEITGARQLTELISQDPNATAVFEEFGTSLGRFLVEFIKLEKPEIIVIGGNIAKAYAYFKEPVENEIRKEDTQVKIVTSVLGEDAMMIGAGGGWYMQEEWKVESGE